MKLKRLLSALIVFTLVMTSVMCSVSAAGTYQAATKYGTDGKVSVTAMVTEAAEGDFVSYIIYGDNVEGEDVTESNIKYINQGTVNSDGVVDFGTVKFDYDKIINRNIKFATNGDELVAGNLDLGTPISYTNPENYPKLVGMVGTGETVEKVSEVNLMATMTMSSLGNQASTSITVHQLVDGELITKPLEYKGGTFINPNASVLTIDWTYKNGRISCDDFKISRIKSYSQNGAAKTAAVLNYTFGNDFVNNRLKLVADENGCFADGDGTLLDIESGDLLEINGSATGKGTEDDSSVQYFKVDAIPYNNVENVDGVDYNAVTFLVSGTGVIKGKADNWGVDVYVYDADKLDLESATGTTRDFEYVKAYENLYDLSNAEKFAIQLVDVAGHGYIGNDAYTLEAVPFYVINGEKFQCTTYGGNYFVPNRTTEVVEVK